MSRPTMPWTISSTPPRTISPSVDHRRATAPAQSHPGDSGQAEIGREMQQLVPELKWVAGAWRQLAPDHQRHGRPEQDQRGPPAEIDKSVSNHAISASLRKPHHAGMWQDAECRDAAADGTLSIVYQWLNGHLADFCLRGPRNGLPAGACSHAVRGKGRRSARSARRPWLAKPGLSRIRRPLSSRPA